MGLKLFKEPCPEVEKLYKAETGRNHYFGDNFTAPPSLLYVEWLENEVKKHLTTASTYIKENKGGKP